MSGVIMKSVPVDEAAFPTPPSGPSPTRIFAPCSHAERQVPWRPTMRTDVPDRTSASASGGDSPSPRPLSPPASFLRARRLARAAALMAAVTRRHRRHSLPPGQPAAGATAARWTLGSPSLDALLPAGALDAEGLTEVKPATAADWPAALAFALALAVRRLDAGPPMAPLAWCWPARRTQETGRPYGPGIAAFGLDPARLLLVETANATETLWAMEEALKSGAAALVLGALEGVQSTPARRLSLAAEAAATPALLLTAPATSGVAATATRWRIARARGGPHPFDPQAPGALRLALTLERCRGAPADVTNPTVLVEWHRETRRFSVVAGVGHRAAAAA